MHPILPFSFAGMAERPMPSPAEPGAPARARRQESNTPPACSTGQPGAPSLTLRNPRGRRPARTRERGVGQRDSPFVPLADDWILLPGSCYSLLVGPSESSVPTREREARHHIKSSTLPGRWWRALRGLPRRGGAFAPPNGNRRLAGNYRCSLTPVLAAARRREHPSLTAVIASYLVLLSYPIVGHLPSIDVAMTA